MVEREEKLTQEPWQHEHMFDQRPRSSKVGQQGPERDNRLKLTKTRRDSEWRVCHLV